MQMPQPPGQATVQTASRAPQQISGTLFALRFVHIFQGQRPEGYCCQGKTNFRASCQVITITAFRTIRRRGCGHCATGPNFQTKGPKKVPDLSKFPITLANWPKQGLHPGHKMWRTNSETWTTPAEMLPPPHLPTVCKLPSHFQNQP